MRITPEFGAPPCPASDRIATLDIVRGVAVMGILLMNIVAFAMPSAAYYNPAAYGGAEGADLGVWTTMFVAVDGKMRGLFSFLFGASLLLVTDRAEAKGEDAGAVHYRRMGWLLLFGLAHLYLLWWGDILAHYALVGMIAFLFRDQPPHKLLILGLVCAGAGFVLLAITGADALTLHATAHGADASADAVAGWTGYEKSFGTPPANYLAKDLAAHRGSYGDLLAWRWAHDKDSPVRTLLYVGPETLGYMLLGMAGLRSGMLTGAWTRARYVKWAAIGFGVGIPGYAALAALAIAQDFDARHVILSVLLLAAILRPPMIAGWAALIILLARPGGRLTARIGAAGRMAFSNYLGTSLICTTLFYGYGFGLYGTLGRAELYLVVIGVWALILLWSKPWLDRFAYGPLEWLWRSLARWKIQPFRKTRAIAT